MIDAFSTPFGAPLVPEFPIRFRNTEILSIWYRSDPAAIAALLPPPLEAVSDLVLVHFYAMHDPDRFGPHREFADSMSGVVKSAPEPTRPQVPTGCETPSRNSESTTLVPLKYNSSRAALER